jgi:hypothetical protein
MASSDVATSTISNNPARRRVTTDLCPWSLRCGSCMTSGWHGATKTAGEHLCQRRFQASPGMRSRRLHEEGLAAAIAELAGVVPARVEIDIPTNRFPRDIEAAAYFLCAEALTNAAKYACWACPVSIKAAGDQVVVTVMDDGLWWCGADAGRRTRGIAGQP